MCGSSIIENKCACGQWKKTDDLEADPLKKTLEFFHEMNRFTLTGDTPHLGCALVLFRGDYKDCKEVERFIFQLKGRPFYDN